MASPAQPTIDLTKANALAAAGTHTGTGATFIPKGTDETSSPDIFTRLTQLQYHIYELLAGSNQGKVIAITDPANLNVGCFAMKYRIGATDYSYAGDVSFACNASQVNHLYLDTAGTLKKQDASWPAGDIVRLAKVTTNGSAVTAIDDCRWMNAQVGVVNNWWAIAPSAAIGCNGQALQNVGLFGFKPPIELTIASGAVTATQSFHDIDTEANAETDDLVTINSALSGSDEGQLLILRAESATREIVVKSTGNIDLKAGNFYMTAGTNLYLILVWNGPTNKWVELFRSPPGITMLYNDLAGNNKSITGLKAVDFVAAEVEIESGAITYGNRIVRLLPEGFSPDNLDTINGGATDNVIWLCAATGSSITIRSGIDNILLSNGQNFTSTGEHQTIKLRRASDGLWVEDSRSFWSLTQLPDTEKAVACDKHVYVSGTLTVNTTYKQKLRMPKDFIFVKAYVAVGTAPVGSACIVDVRYNGASLFANEGEMANVAAGANSATSSTKNSSHTGGSDLEVRTGTSVGSGTPAADLSVTIECRAARL